MVMAPPVKCGYAEAPASSHAHPMTRMIWKKAFLPAMPQCGIQPKFS